MSQDLLVKVFSAVFSIGAILLVIYLIDIYARRKARRVLEQHKKEQGEVEKQIKENKIKNKEIGKAKGERVLK